MYEKRAIVIARFFICEEKFSQERDLILSHICHKNSVGINKTSLTWLIFLLIMLCKWWYDHLSIRRKIKCQNIKLP